MLDVALTVEPRCAKWGCHHIVSTLVILLCKHFIKQESLNLLSKYGVIYIFANPQQREKY